MRLTKTLGMAGALILSAILGGTLIGATLATDSETDADALSAEAGAYCETFMETFAAELGATSDEVVAAAKVAATAALDEAVAAGDVSEERAAAIRERIDAFDGSRCGIGAFKLGFGHGFGRGLARGFLGGDVFATAADALGIETEELVAQLADSDSLQAVAEELGVSYDEAKAAIIAAVQADLDAAVEAGRIDQERADSVIERLTTWLDNGGQLRGRGGQWGGPGRPGGEDDTGA